MGESDEKSQKVRSGDTPGELSKVRVGDDPRAPWWVNYAMRAFLVIGLPTALIAVREAKDYRFEAQRLEVEVKRVETEQKRNVIFERFEKVLYRVEKKLPDESR